MNINFLILILNSLLLACPLIILASGGILNTRAGIANFGFDGILCAGAAVYCIAISVLKSSLGNYSVILALLLSVLTGLAFSLIFSLATVTFRANQILISMAINYIGYGLALALPILFLGSNYFSITAIYIKVYPWAYILTTLILVFLLAMFFLLTKYGLQIRAIGENPNVAALSYIHVRKLRYTISNLSCSLASFSGGFFVFIRPDLFLYKNNFSGLGFLIIAILLIGCCKFVLTAIFCICFSFLFELCSEIQAFAFVNETLPTWFFAIIPYLSALLLLIIFRYKQVLPLAWGQPYIRTAMNK